MKNRTLLADLSNGMAHGLAHDLEVAFGTIDMVSPWFSFDYTDYYAAEMGGPLYRRMLVFEELIPQDALARIKWHHKRSGASIRPQRQTTGEHRPRLSAL